MKKKQRFKLQPRDWAIAALFVLFIDTNVVWYQANQTTRTVLDQQCLNIISIVRPKRKAAQLYRTRYQTL